MTEFSSLVTPAMFLSLEHGANARLMQKLEATGRAKRIADLYKALRFNVDNKASQKTTQIPQKLRLYMHGSQRMETMSRVMLLQEFEAAAGIPHVHTSKLLTTSVTAAKRLTSSQSHAATRPLPPPPPSRATTRGAPTRTSSRPRSKRRPSYLEPTASSRAGDPLVDSSERRDHRHDKRSISQANLSKSTLKQSRGARLLPRPEESKGGQYGMADNFSFPRVSASGRISALNTLRSRAENTEGLCTVSLNSFCKGVTR